MHAFTGSCKLCLVANPGVYREQMHFPSLLSFIIHLRTLVRKSQMERVLFVFHKVQLNCELLLYLHKYTEKFGIFNYRRDHSTSIKGTETSWSSA